MAGPTINGGRIEIEIAGRIDKFHAAARQAEKDAVAAGKKIAAGLDRGMGTGDKAAQRWMKGLETAFDRDVKRAREKLFRGLIDEKEFQRRGTEAAERFNQGLLSGLDRQRAKGKVSDAMTRSLIGELKDAGRKAGAGLSEGVQQGMQKGSGGALNWFKGVFILQAGQMAAGLARSVTGAFNQAIDQAQSRVRGQMRLGSTALLYGVDKEQLQGVQRSAVDRYRVEASAATDLAIVIGKLGAKSGETARMQEMLGAALDLGAAQGYNAEQAAKALEQALLRIDEGTDKLFGKNPSVLYEEYAVSIGKTAGQLSDMEEKQAIVSALFRDGARVAGTYAAAQENASGKLDQQRMVTSGLVTQMGDALLPLVAEAAETLNRLLGPAIEGLIGFMDRLKTPLERNIDLLRDMGAAAAEVAPLLLQAKLEDRRGFIQRTERDLALARQTGFQTSNMTGGRAKMETRSIFDLQQRQRELTNKASAGQLSQAEAAESRRITNIIRLEQQLAQAHTDVANAQGAINAAEAGADRERTIRNLKAEIDLLEERGQVVMASRKRERLAELEGQRETIAKPATPAAAAAKKSSSEKAEENARRQAAEDLQARIRERAVSTRYGLSPFGDAPTTATMDMPAALNQVLQLDREIRQIEKEIKTARDEAPAGANALLESYQAQKAVVEGIAKTWAEKLGTSSLEPQLANVTALSREMMVATEEGVLPLGEALQGVAAATKKAADAQRALRDAHLAGEKEEIAKATRAQADAEKDVGVAAARAMTILRTGLGQGALSQKKMNQLVEEMVKLLQEAGVEIEDLGDSAGKDWQKMAETAEGVARGVLSIADSMGLLDDRSRQALQGVIDVASGVGRLIASGGTDIGAWVQTIGGAFQAGKAMFGGDKDAKEARESMRSLTSALEQLNKTILDDLTTRQVEADRAAIARASGLLGKDDDRKSRYGHVRRRSLAELSEDLGLGNANDKDGAIAALQEWAAALDQKYGTTNLAEFIANSDSEGFLAALNKLQQQLGKELTEMGTFGTDAEGIIARVNWQFKVLGKTDVVERLKAVNQALKEAGKTAGQFQDELDELAGLDLTTEAGRKRRDEIVAEVMRQMLAGGADFGELTPAQMRALLEEWAAAAGPEGADGETRSYQVTRSITEVTGSRLVGILTTIAFWTETIARGMGHGQGITTLPLQESSGIDLPPGSMGPAGIRPPQTTPTSPPPGTTEGGFGIGSVQVYVTPPAGMTSEEASRLGHTIGGAAVDEIDIELGRRTRDRRRAMGDNRL